MLMKLIKLVLLLAVLFVAVVGGYVAFFMWRHNEFADPTYDTLAPQLPEMPLKSRVLVFSKTNGFRHIEAIPAANAMFTEFASQEGWSIFFTENAAVHNTGALSQFDLVIWNNVSGDVLTEKQRGVFRDFLESGGRFLAMHGSGGDPEYQWDHYPAEIIKAQFIGHPMFPQFRLATLTVEDRDHPATEHLAETWERTDEWYSFAESPRARVNVLMSIQEDTYNPEELAMGEDHPMMWHHRVGEGYVFYSALGHTAESYAEPEYRQLLLKAASWLLANETQEESNSSVESSE